MRNQSVSVPSSSANLVQLGAEEPLAELARDLLAAGDIDGAVDAYEQAIALGPHRADLLAELGSLRQELNDPDAALSCYRRAVEVDPGNISARQNLGYLLCNLGEPEQALAEYDALLARWPSPISQMLAAMVLPVIYDSLADVQAWRQRFAARVQNLAAQGLRVDTTRSQIPTNFLLAYQGENDREIAADLGRIYQGCQLQNTNAPPGNFGRRLRVGFLSAFYRDHTIGRLNLGTVQHLSRDNFEVVVLSATPTHDSWSTAYQQAADQFVEIPRNVELARQIIVEQALDVLIFSDVGMDAITSTLVYSRMAPVQCVTWGHPDTTGSPAVDYFLSSALIETADADAHYTEQLIRLPLLGVYYHRPQITAGMSGRALAPGGTVQFAVPPGASALPIMNPGQPSSRESFGLTGEQHVYVCPQTHYKFHPDFDLVLSGILQADPRAELVLLEGRVGNWTARLRKRFARTLPESGRRVRFLPPQNYDSFLSLLAISDVVLDPLHFGGGNSSYEALAMGAPLVTLPSPYLRGRITQALYKKMDYPDLTVCSPDEYIRTAVRLATDSVFNRQVRRQISERSPVLFEDLNEIRGWEDFLSSLGSRR